MAFKGVLPRLQNSIKYADLAMQHNRYNAKALVNKGNCMFMRGEYDHARSMYQEAMGAEADCLEAIYNSGKIEGLAYRWEIRVPG